jgi:putative thiamine transport system substrate-binding protein
LARPVTDAAFERATAPLWDYLDRLHPHLWRDGRSFPSSGPELSRLLADGEIDIAFNFNPAEASRMIADGLLPPSVRTFVLDGGTIGNTHFVAIPFNASARAGAMVVADFLLSPEAQARKQDPDHWGDFTVLDLDRLDAADRALFEAIDLGPATLPPQALGTPLPEPHPSWMVALEAAWLARYADG